MPVIEQEEVFDAKPVNTTKHLPTIIKWKGVNMIRKESFLAAIKEIAIWAEHQDITKVGFVGGEGSGKTSMASCIAHCLHKESKIPFVVKKFTAEELMDFENTLKNLQNANHILIFDDVSFLSAKHSKKTMDVVKEAVTKIRHLEGGHDVKIVLIYNYHYTKALDKYLRTADFRFFTSVGSEERDNMEAIVGKKNMHLVDFLPKARQQGIIKGFFPSPLQMPNNKKFFYKWQNPFIPVLFWNNNNLRMIISPLRKWIDPICSICAGADKGQSEVSIEQFCKESEDKWEKQTFLMVVKQLLKEQGIITYSKKYVQARRYLDRALETKQFNIEDIALHYDLKQTRTRLDKKLDGVLE